VIPVNLEEKIMGYLTEKRYSLLKAEISQYPAVDIAEIFEKLDPKYRLLLFRLLPKDQGAEVFSYLSKEEKRSLILAINDRELREIISELAFDDLIDALEEMPANAVKKILKESSEEDRQLINQFLNYPVNSAGSLMTIEYVDLKKEMTVDEALAHVKKTGPDKETIYTCYVIDNNRKLEGLISLRRLVLSKGDELVGDIMNTEVVSVTTHEDQEEVANLFKRYGLLSIPVVDKEGRLVGIITIDDAVDVIVEESTEDFEKMAAIHPSEYAYLKTNVFTLFKNRIVWLAVLMLSASVTGTIISRYENMLQSAVLLAAFIPMLMDAGGNAGSQSSVLVIRGLALKEIEFGDILRVVWKEFRVGCLVGLALAAINYLRVFLFVNAEKRLAFTVSLTLFITIVLAKTVGGTLPILAKKFKLDPAIMASPLITTIVDALALLIYFRVASAIIGI